MRTIAVEQQHPRLADCPPHQQFQLGSFDMEVLDFRGVRNRVQCPSGIGWAFTAIRFQRPLVAAAFSDFWHGRKFGTNKIIGASLCHALDLA